METPAIREPAVSGKFYPAHKEELLNYMGKLAGKIPSSVDKFSEKFLLGGIVPHAGYIYSAGHAAPFFYLLSKLDPAPETVVILCPNHNGYGPPLALDAARSWNTPLGLTNVDQEFYPFLDIEVAPEAHQLEHSAEVMLPLLQYYMEKPFSILPISMRDQTPQTARWLAKKLTNAKNKLKKNFAIIASSDFSHFVTPDAGRTLDDKVLEKINGWDTDGVFTTICQDDISVCGYGPIMTLMELAHMSLKNPGFEIISRGHSGETYPSSEVVHYVSAIVYEKS